MNLPFHLPNLFKRQPHAEVRYIVPTRQERTAAKRLEASRRTSIMAELAIYNATTTPQQRASETEAYFAKARQTPLAEIGRAGR